jgi:hypothetical protein
MFVLYLRLKIFITSDLHMIFFYKYSSFKKLIQEWSIFNQKTKILINDKC